MKVNRTVRFLPLLIFIGLIIGVLIGTFFTSRFVGNKLNIINASTNKLNEMLYIVLFILSLQNLTCILCLENILL